MAPKQPTPLLDTVSSPADIRDFDEEQLKQLAGEVRADMIDAVSLTGGHLGAGLGVVELTVALHHIFDTPRDRLMGRGTPKLSAQNIDRTTGAVALGPPGRRYFRLYQTQRKRIRPLWRGP